MRKNQMKFIFFPGFVISSHEIFVSSNTGMHQILADIEFSVDLLTLFFGIALISTDYLFVDINAVETLDLTFVDFSRAAFSNFVSKGVID